jgi:hypothetical protein
MATTKKNMRKKSTSSLRGSVELALAETEQLINSAKSNELPEELVEKVKIGIFEPLQRAQKKLEKITSARKNKAEATQAS